MPRRRAETLVDATASVVSRASWRRAGRLTPSGGPASLLDVDLEDPAAEPALVLAPGDRILVLTGAGISAESGVPTFRGPGGLWRTYRPEDLATPEAFARDPKLV